MKMRGFVLAGAVVLCCVLATGRAQAQQIFLEIPGIAGEATAPGFENQIEVHAVSFGAVKICGGGQLNLSSLNLVKSTDRSSVDLAIALRDQTVLPSATFRFTRADNQVYQSYQLVNAVIESLQVSGAAGSEPRTTESASLTAAQVIITYTYIDGGGKAGSPESMTYTSAGCP
jgi:type VI protein secretion system component Hcp